ncbi:A-kinase anchor protein 13-like [Saccoglossus kowalevskii]|uniref:A-kinase anchor protein 13-like n=1 Tax=Saccoglossus kowalevskii TaxID=10224 RepID=A0ABM0ML19_SACKO|nr:PREDICTED: A-kinase anchor protein 13-like [Saccoglossus kowalevskii]
MDSQELCRMAFSPQSSPVYGGKTIVVAFADENSLPKEKEIFLVFEGSASRHITSVNRLNAFTLQAVIPGHDRSEVVQLSVCLFHDNQHIVVAQGKFEFMEDPVQIFAAWLLDSVHDANALDKDETIIQNSGFDFCAEDKSILDVQLASAFENLTIPHSWSIVGDTSRLEQEPPPRETLLHFAARQGFSQFAMLLLNKPGSDVSLRLPNKHGEFPRDIARERGLDSLVDTMHEYTGDSSPECENRSRSYRKHCIGTATVTNKVMVESNTEIGK